jgi:imidazolonepropionase-like amidohydrolase
MGNMRVLFFFIYIISAPAAGLGSDFLALTNGVVIDPGSGSQRSGTTILVEGERIRAVFRDGERSIPDGSLVHDLDGRFVIPGLIESHTHLSPLISGSPGALDRELERMLRGGVVALRDMAGNAARIAAVRQRIASGETSGPDIFYSAVMGGPHFAANDPRVTRASGEHPAGEAPWAQTVTRETDVRRAVSRAVASGATALKLYVEIEPEMIRALSEEAHRQGLRVWSHATVYPARPMDAVRAGVDVLSHLCGLAWEDADLDPAAQKRISVKNRPSFDPARVEADSPEMTLLFEEMARRGTMLDATLSNHLRPGDDAYGCTSDLVIALAKAAHRDGVRLVAGTDYNPPTGEPSPSLHFDIEALVDHGILSPAEALAAATLHGAHALGMPNDYGAIEPGKLASLVVLAGNPLENIRAIRSVVMVIKRGNAVFPQHAEALAWESSSGAE